MIRHDSVCSCISMACLISMEIMIVLHLSDSSMTLKFLHIVQLFRIGISCQHLHLTNKISYTFVHVSVSTVDFLWNLTLQEHHSQNILLSYTCLKYLQLENTESPINKIVLRTELKFTFCKSLYIKVSPDIGIIHLFI